jgi:hypothetical protein
MEGWHVISEANRIFGYDAWDRRTLTSNCVWSGTSGQHYLAAYTAKVQISVRTGDSMIVREGSGTAEGRALTPGQAHELALKGAETDATKRALATFGNRRVFASPALQGAPPPPVHGPYTHCWALMQQASRSPVSLQQRCARR